MTVAFGLRGSFSRQPTVCLLVSCSQLDLDDFTRLLYFFYGLVSHRWTGLFKTTRSTRNKAANNKFSNGKLPVMVNAL